MELGLGCGARRGFPVIFHSFSSPAMNFSEMKTYLKMCKMYVYFINIYYI